MRLVQHCDNVLRIRILRNEAGKIRLAGLPLARIAYIIARVGEENAGLPLVVQIMLLAAVKRTHGAARSK